MPVQGGSITGNAVLGFRGIVLLQAMRIYLQTNGRMQASRGATPSNMRADLQGA